MKRPRLELADVFRQYRELYRRRFGASTSREQWRVMGAVETCRTAALGGHVEACDACGHEVISYNSCRNRHCPKCQSLAKAKWLQARHGDLLPVPYYHVVFTIPSALGSLALQNKRVVYDILFQTASQTLLTIAADPKHLGARLGFLAILHTWGQNLMGHPHVHCVVPGGGISHDEHRWVSCKPKFFLPVRVLSRLFRRLFLEQLEKAFQHKRLELHGPTEHLSTPQAFARLLAACRQSEWVVYAKPPFGGPDKVLDYLGRYTHRIAISNDRLLTMNDGKITFGLKNYRRDGRRERMTLNADEFIRRFLLHVLPDGFVRIRYFGFLANRHRAKKLKQCRELLNVRDASAHPETKEPRTWVDLLIDITGNDPLKCPKCRRGHLARLRTLAPQHHGAHPRSRASPSIDSS